jgi:hypothetical protein
MRAGSTSRHSLTHLVLALGLLAGCAEARLQKDAAEGGSATSIPGHNPRPARGPSTDWSVAGSGAFGAVGGGGNDAFGAGGAAGYGVGDPLGTSTCGNGLLEVYERCERADLNGATCRSLGYGSGELRCNVTTCEFDTIRCIMYVAGAGGSPNPDGSDDDAGLSLSLCTPAGPCSSSGVCAVDGRSCEKCLDEIQCQRIYGNGFVCVGGTCAIPL